MSAEGIEKRSGISGNDMKNVKAKEARPKKEPLSFGEVVDRLSTDDWRILIDLYFCRCMPLSAATKHYFSKSPEEEYKKEWATASPEEKVILTQKAMIKWSRRSERRMRDLYHWGLLERSTTNAEEVRKAPADRVQGVKVEPWYFLSQRGLRLVELKINIDDESRLSKMELDMERAKKDHFWALAQVYLELRYELMEPAKAKQFEDWNWYPSLTIYGHKEMSEVRPDAVLLLMDQVYYIEMDRSTEPIYRNPFLKGDAQQVSIENKMERYKAVLHHSDAPEIQRSGIIAFIVPDAIYKTRLENIRAVARKVFTKNYNTQVLVGRNIQEIILKRAESAKRAEGED